MVLANALALLKQAYQQKKELCFLKKTKETARLLTILQSIGVISGLTFGNNYICVFLRYKNNIVGLRKANLISKPSHRVYLRRQQLTGKKFFGYYTNTGCIIMRTSYKSYWLTDAECAMLGLGGEPVLVVG